METQDNCCSFVPYFRIHEGKIGEVKALCEQFMEKTRNEAKVLYYGFSFDGDQMHCRKGYQDAEGLLAHLQNVGDILRKR
jgi:quinol monooxygenase YgiN